MREERLHNLERTIQRLRELMEFAPEFHGDVFLDVTAWINEVKDVVLASNSTHVFKPREDDPDFCARCGLGFRSAIHMGESGRSAGGEEQ